MSGGKPLVTPHMCVSAVTKQLHVNVGKESMRTALAKNKHTV